MSGTQGGIMLPGSGFKQPLGPDRNATLSNEGNASLSANNYARKRHEEFETKYVK